MIWKTLLATTDLTEASRPALDLALSLQRQMGMGVSVHLLYVVDVDSVRASNADFSPDANAYDHTLESFEGRLSVHALEELGRFVAPVRDEGERAAIALHVALGDVVTRILDLAGKIGADAIFIATHARQGVSRMFLGSVAEQIVHSAACPVVSVRIGMAELPPPDDQD